MRTGPRTRLWRATVTVVATLTAGVCLQAEIVRRGPTRCADVALTFDMCPVRQGNGFDAPLVDELVEHHIPATFFLSGRWMETHDADVRRLLAVPFFEIGTHGETHAHLPLLTAAAQQKEMLDPVAHLNAAYHRRAMLFRPPYGEYTPETEQLAESAGLKFVLWSVVSGDPDPKLSAASIVRDVESRTRPGSVIVFHANGRGWHTREVVDDLYQWLLTRRALQPVTLTTLLGGCTDGHTTAPRR